jgi:TM2 domain-containing membrane protein YozV
MSDYYSGSAGDPQPMQYGHPQSSPPYGPPPPGYTGQPNQMMPYQQQPHPAGGYQGYPPPYGQPGGYVTQYDAFGRPLSDKSKVVAGVLGIALGGFGAGRFYTGHTGMAVAQLLVTLATCGLGHFWGLIDGIMLLVNGGTDAQGRVLRD